MTTDTRERIKELLTLFKLPTMAAECVRRFDDAGHDEALLVLAETLEAELGERRVRRCDRLLRASKLPPAKTFETLDDKRLPRGVAPRLRELASGDFLERAANILCFGLPGTGKTHAACALGHALVQRGHAVLFTPTFQLVQDLLAAKRDLALPRALRRLAVFEVIILDDLGYVQQTADEVEVLFTLMAERCERRAIILTTNPVFGGWARSAKNPTTAAAAIDRLVHHSVIREFDGPSIRAEEAKKRNSKKENAKQN